MGQSEEQKIFPSGTQVMISNSTEIDPIIRGKPGVIIPSPIEMQDGYFLVRMPDQSTGIVYRDNLRTRKGIQMDGMYNPPRDEDYHDLIIYRCMIGSRAYGLSNDSSDEDIRGIYLPTAEMHWSLFGFKEQFEEGEDGVFWEFEKFLRLALKANPNILESLYTPMVIYASETAVELLENRHRFLSKTVYATYNGYAMSQFKKLEQDLRAAIREAATARSLITSHTSNDDESGYIERYLRMPLSEALKELDINIADAIRWKHAMHLIRLLKSGIHLLTEGEVLVDVGALKEELLPIRRGEVPWEEVEAWEQRLHKEFDNAYNSSKIADKPDFEWVNRFLIDTRLKMARRGNFELF